MIYPVKIEFKEYPLGNWQDWSQFLVEAPSTNQRVESENEGEAGVIVFDTASVTFRYESGTPVYTAFNTDLTSKQRYLFRISFLKSNKTYEQRMEGMADFSTIEWPEREQNLISFEIVDKLSALGILSAEVSRTESSLETRILAQQPDAYSLVYSILATPSNQMSLEVIDEEDLRLYLTTPIIFPGEILLDPRSILVPEFGTVRHVVLTSTIADGINVLTVSPEVQANPDLNVIDLPIGEGNNLYLSKELYGVDINNVVVDELVNLKGTEVVKALYNQAWPGESLTLIPADLNFAIPPDYSLRMTDENPLGDTPLAALSTIINSVKPSDGNLSGCYLFINKSGSPVIYVKDNISSGTTRTLGTTRVIRRRKKYFWDKLVDGADVTVESWILDPETNEYLSGSGTQTLKAEGFTGFIKPKNNLSKKIIAPLLDPPLATQDDLNLYAAQEAENILEFYGKRRCAYEFDLNLDDNTIQWELVDNLWIDGVQYFFIALEVDPVSRIMSLEAIEVLGHTYDFRQIIVGLSEANSVGYLGGGSGASGSNNLNLTRTYTFDTPFTLDETGKLFLKNLALDTGDILALRKTNIPQEFRIYNTYPDADNNEFISLGYKNNTNVFTIESEKASNGVIRNLALMGGKVGIGTANPLKLLDIYSSSDADVFVRGNGGSATVTFFDSTSNDYIKSTGGHLTLGTTTNERMRIASSGNVGIGTTSPAALFHVSKTGADTTVFIEKETGRNGSIWFRTGSSYRWGISANNTAEGGSDAGSDFAIYNRHDDGSAFGTPFFIKRSTGNVGIGTSNPGSNLEVMSSGTTTIAIRSNALPGTESLNFLAADGSARLGVLGHTESSTANDYIFMGRPSNDGTALGVYIKPNTGFVGIGITNPASKLHILADIDTNALQLVETAVPARSLFLSGSIGGKARILSAYNLIIATGQQGGSRDLELSPTGDIKITSGSIGSSTYVSQLTGWKVTNAGAGDFRYIYTDELHAKAFIADLEQALAGSQIICKSVAKVYADYTPPAPSVQGTRLIVESFAGFEIAAVFQNGDNIRLRQFSRTSGGLTITDAWGTVTLDTTYGSSGFDSATKTQAYIFTRNASLPGNASGAIKAGTLALDYGISGNGFIESNAIDGLWAANSPYTQIVTWSSLPNNYTVHNRTGKLTGITDADFGGSLPSDYGTYINGTAFIKGNIFVKATNQLALSNTSIMMGNISGTANNAIKISQTGTAATSGIMLYDSSANELLKFALDGSRHIANWNFDNAKFYKGTAAAGFSLNTSSTPYITGNNSKGFEVYDVTSPKMFLGLRDGSGNLSKGFDWNVSTANEFTMKGNILASKFSTKAIFGGEEVGVDIDGNGIVHYYDDGIRTLSTSMRSGQFWLEVLTGETNTVYANLNSFGLMVNDNKLLLMEDDYLGFRGLRLTGDYSLTSDSGSLTLEPNGDLILNPSSNSVLPPNDFEINLGAVNKKYLQLYCSEIVAQNLVAQNVMATIGGRILVGQTNTLIDALLSLDVSILVKYQFTGTLPIICYLESVEGATNKVEFIRIDTYTGPDSGGYRYAITRNLDGSGANLWYKGDVVFNTGAVGSGFIDLYSFGSIKGGTQIGPSIVGNIRNSATYNDWSEGWAIGNLAGLYGQSAGTFGVGLGKYADNNHFMLATGGGIQFKKRASGTDTITASWASDGAITLGSTSGPNVVISSGSIQLKSGNDVRIQLNSNGSGFISDGGIMWNTTGSISISGVIYAGGAADDINNNMTTIDGGKIETGTITADKIHAGTITTDKLNFTPVLGNNVVASINASAEGITINANKLTLSGVLQVGGAAADINGGVTTISGSKITSGTITADRLATDQAMINWLNARNIVAGSVAAENITGTTITGKSITGSSLRTSPASGNDALLSGSGLTFFNNNSFSGGVVNSGGDLIIQGSNSTTIGNSNAVTYVYATNFIWNQSTVATQDWANSRFSLTNHTHSYSTLNVSTAYQVNGTQVVASRQTGWETPLGPTSKATFNPGTVTLSGLASRVAALINDLISHGLIGA